MNEIKVDIAVLVMTYNHAKFLSQCLDSIVSQKCTCTFAVIVHDDCSEDGTGNILKEYEKKYPSIIIAMYEETNQYSKGQSFTRKMLNKVRCRYVAACEGDDYWIDRYKLQKEFDYFETHDRCSCSFSNGIVVDYYGHPFRSFFSNYIWRDQDINSKLSLKSAEFDVDEIIRLDFTPTASLFCRLGVYEEYLTFPYKLDLSKRLVCTYLGYSHYFGEKFAAYRTGNTSSASGIAIKDFDSYYRNYYIKHCTILDAFDKYSNGKYHATISTEKLRKLIETYLAFGLYKRAQEISEYKNIKPTVKIKLFVKRYFGFLFNLMRGFRNRIIYKQYRDSNINRG